MKMACVAPFHHGDYKSRRALGGSRLSDEWDVAMRVTLALAACVIVFAGQGPTLAASCGKGMLWPYVRNPGDCLTDAEIKAGQTGTYNGPVNTNPDISGIRIEKPAQNVITTVTPSAPVAAASRPLATAPARELTSVSPNGVRTNLANVPRDDAVS